MLARGALRVGVSENQPWVVLKGGEPAGVEPALIRDFAASQGVRVEWVRNGESPLFKALENHDLDIVAAGLLASTPWKSALALSQPYAGSMKTEQHVLATAPGENQLLLRLDRFIAARPHLKETP
jgi:membrane-bound lytic murein transglycosylase MltF